MTQKKSPEAMTFAVTDFLAGLRLTGSERVLGALALREGQAGPRTARDSRRAR
jgi:hypothetical protein